MGDEELWQGRCRVEARWHRGGGADGTGVGGTLEHHNVAAQVQEPPQHRQLLSGGLLCPPVQVQKVHVVLHLLRLKKDPVCRR